MFEVISVLLEQLFCNHHLYYDDILFLKVKRGCVALRYVVVVQYGHIPPPTPNKHPLQESNQSREEHYRSPGKWAS